MSEFLVVVHEKCAQCPAGDSFAHLTALESELGSKEAVKTFYSLSPQAKRELNPVLNDALITWARAVTSNRLTCPCDKK